MATLGQNFTKAEKDAGWPETLEHGQLAALQYPNFKVAKARAADIVSACDSGDLLHTVTTKTVMTKAARNVTPSKFSVKDWSPAHTLGGVAYAYTIPAQYKDVTTYNVTAPDFAAWLAAQPEAPSDRIAAWFEAVGANTQPEAAPVPTPQPIVSAATQARNKRRDDFWSLIEDAQKDLADPFDTAAIWLRLCEWAQAKEKKFPLMGMAGDIIQWRIDNLEDPKEFTRKMLSDRLGKQKKAQQRKPKPPLKRVK